MPKRSALTALGVAALLVVTTDSISAAVGGPTLHVGGTTTAHRTTTLKNTGAGPALSLKAKGNTAPLAVSNGNLVKKLNADRVDGLDAGSLGVQTTTYDLDGLPSSGASVTVPVPPLTGTYLVSFSATLTNSAGTPSAPIQAACQLFDATQYKMIATATSTSYNPSLNATGVVSDLPQTTFTCVHSGGGDLTFMRDSTLTLTRITQLRHGSLAVAPGRHRR